MKKIVAIDGNEANISNRVGVNVYAFNLLWGLYKLQDQWKNEFEVVVFVKSKPLKDMPAENSGWQYRVLDTKLPLWVLTRLTGTLWTMSPKPCVLLSLSHYTSPIAPCPTICAIMDLGYLSFTEQFKKSTFWQLKYWTAISLFVSKQILAISNSTKDDIVRHYPFTSKKISVTHLAYDNQRFNHQIPAADVRRIKQRYSIVDDYILYLGTLKPSKNVEGLLEAFAIVTSKSNSKKLQLVIAGMKGWMFDAIYQRVIDLQLKDRVIFTDFFPEEDKPALMVGAAMLVAPSFWEGFGLHALEAMAGNTPVVVSNQGSFPEIVGEAGFLVNPNLTQSIADGILKVLNLSRKDQEVLKKKMALQAAKFTWVTTAQKTLTVLRQVGGIK